MSIGELGALGEFVGAIAVFVTLLYLAIQVRQNSGIGKTQLNNAAIEAFARVREQQNQHAEVVVKMQDGEPLNGAEGVIASNIMSEALFASAMGYENSRMLNPPRQAVFVSVAVGVLQRYRWPLERNAAILESAGFDDFIRQVRARLDEPGALD